MIWLSYFLVPNMWESDMWHKNTQPMCGQIFQRKIRATVSSMWWLLASWNPWYLLFIYTCTYSTRYIYSNYPETPKSPSYWCIRDFALQENDARAVFQYIDVPLKLHETRFEHCFIYNYISPYHVWLTSDKNKKESLL